MPELKRSEALKLIGRLEGRRDLAIKEGDFDTAAAASVKISELEAALADAEGESEPRRERLGCLPIVLIAVLVALVFSELGGGSPNGAEPVDGTATVDAPPPPPPPPSPPLPTASSLRIAAEFALREVARDPESVEVEACAPEAGVPLTTVPLPMKCVYRARNGFGGMNRSVADLAYLGVGDAVLITTE